MVILKLSLVFLLIGLVCKNIVKCYEYQECKTTVKGAEYRGTKSTTKYGIPCQKWTDQSPQSHSRTPSKYPYAGLDKNYCRNPNPGDIGHTSENDPWCYTMDAKKRWQYCDVPMCDHLEECKTTRKGAEYRGTKSTTISGITCQKWADQSPHSHSRTPSKYPYDGLDKNYCRNPNPGDIGHSSDNSPWCYTMDAKKRWAYCGVPMCHYLDECKTTRKGTEYRGTKSTTKSGITCQKWADQLPHSHSRRPSRFPYAGLDKNYCRNPNPDDIWQKSGNSPWCYTMDRSKTWEYCDVPLCQDEDH